MLSPPLTQQHRHARPFHWHREKWGLRSLFFWLVIVTDLCALVSTPRCLRVGLSSHVRRRRSPCRSTRSRKRHKHARATTTTPAIKIARIQVPSCSGPVSSLLIPRPGGGASCGWIGFTLFARHETFPSSRSATVGTGWFRAAALTLVSRETAHRKRSLDGFHRLHRADGVENLHHCCACLFPLVPGGFSFPASGRRLQGGEGSSTRQD